MKNKFELLQEIYDTAFRNGLIDKFYTIGIADRKEITLYYGKSIKDYEEIKRVSFPFELDPGTRAAFPVEENGQSAAILGKDVFSTVEDMVVVIHEFVHCKQFETCYLKLKEELDIFQHYKSLNNYMWEIEHPFPYQNEDIKALYADYCRSLKNGTEKEIHGSKRKLKEKLYKMDFEYMVWTEWNEGFARYIENQLRKLTGLEVKENLRELNDRVNFYECGELFIKRFNLTNEPLETIFYSMNSIE